MEFQLHSEYQPAGDQPQAIEKLVAGVQAGERAQILLGVTGSGKTFTIANVIARLKRPTLVLSHNKTLAAQLYGELKQFFPNNAVEYFISYYDYYQPEAYLPTTNTYIEKDLSINKQIERLRLSAVSALISGRRDVIVVASVSCIYGIGNPHEFKEHILQLTKGQVISRNKLLSQLVHILYNRTEVYVERGSFRVRGDTVDVFPPYVDFAYRIIFWGDEIENIQRIDPSIGMKISEEHKISIFPANLFVVGKDLLQTAIKEIQDDLVAQIKLFESEGKYIEAQRIKERTESDLEMIRELGYCNGIENYSRYFDRRPPGAAPFCLLDYFPKDYLMIIDESHVTVPQIRAMWGGDRSRKITLVDYGFRLPSALDNRPLTFNEFEEKINQVIFVSATPGEYELTLCEGVVVEQIIRPTGLIDPEISVRPCKNQIEDLIEEIDDHIKRGGRVLVTTLTKRMAEELTKYLARLGIKTQYIHSEIQALKRVEILRQLRLGMFDVLVGVNLLREGLDLPEVSLVAIMDADKEGFLRSQRSLIQTIGRAARNVEGKVIMYADTITQSMREAIEETNRRRKIQQAYNEAHGITPKTIRKSKEAIMKQTAVADARKPHAELKFYQDPEDIFESLIAEPVIAAMDAKQLDKLIQQTQKNMEKAAKELDFIQAARLRDELIALKKRREELLGIG
ncbi:MAG: excinuclease ABC subunit UvrB [Cytophagales bacterium]|nr:excinuclease ABC subunit UvrB [Cytophagales bacterium]